MRFHKTPYHLRQNIDDIISIARKNITVQYMDQKWGKTTRGFVACNIIDKNDYREYFFEPNKFEMPEIRMIRCIDQKSAYQNAMIALKRWENETRDFLSKPKKKSQEFIGEVVLLQKAI